MTRRANQRIWAVTSIILMAFVSPALAKVIYVDANGPADFNNIQAAINDANDGDTIIVADGTYTGDGNRDIEFLGKEIVLRSENGPENCIIDCQHYGRGFHFNNDEDPNSILDGFTIKNGYAQSYGGGILCEQSSPTIVDCRVIGNTGIGNCFGGGISCYYWSSPLIKNCLISENSAAYGGAISCSSSSGPTIVNCLLIGNDAKEYGGGIYCIVNYLTPNIINCTISNNTAYGGGALDLRSSTAKITNCIFWGNSPSEIFSFSTNDAAVTYSNIQGGWYGEGNIDAEPLFASPGDYHLVFGSPCIDAGTNNPPGGLSITDLDGNNRPFDGDYDGNSVADMGAYEFHRGPENPILALTPAKFRFIFPLGGPDPSDKILYIWNAGGGLLNWQIAADSNWLKVHPISGESSGEIDEAVLSVDANGLDIGKYDCVLTVSDPCDSNNVRFVPVMLSVGPLYVPDDYNNIQTAINAAFDGDEVIVADGVYTGKGNHDIDFQGKAITVRSENGPNDCVIDCQGTTQNSHRGFYFHSCENEDSILDGFTIINGYSSEGVLPLGGAIFCLNACTNPTIRNCIIRENTAGSGGGIYCYSSSPTIMNCIITDNYAYHDKGGGIVCWDHSNAKIIGCTIVNNEAKYFGGGTYFYAGNPVLTNSILWGNTANNSLQQIKTPYNPPTNLSVTYCNVQGGWPGVGNIDADPYFVDEINGDFHLKSQAGRWDANSESWVRDASTSPCVDAGNPGCPVSDEPAPNGNRRNMGAYGGTTEASKSPGNGRNIADLTNDWAVDSNDLKVFADYWLQMGECIPGDFDRSQFVDFNDFAILGGQWRQKGPGPGITYEVSQCIPTEFASSTAEEPGETRFTVTVEGSNINFEDLVTANCCLDEIELLMTVEGNLIMIREIEHLTTPCFCVCDYPITAKLGPFEPGIYILEVYQDGTFIGSTTVTIAPPG
ncbi:MAG: right-handed parallel beta-helix repeat-containing protein [Planctomycetota bacterium]